MTGNSKLGKWPRIAISAAGAALVARAVLRRSPINIGLGIVGAELIRMGVTGQALLRPPRKQPPALIEDMVDLASELSFPASDPPAY